MQYNLLSAARRLFSSRILFSHYTRVCAVLRVSCVIWITDTWRLDPDV